MTLPGNGTLKRIIAALVAGALLFLAGAVLSNSNRLSVAETKIQAIVTTQDETKRTLETNRIENRDEHRLILDEIRRGQKK